MSNIVSIDGDEGCSADDLLAAIIDKHPDQCIILHKRRRDQTWSIECSDNVRPEDFSHAAICINVQAHTDVLEIYGEDPENVPGDE